MMIFQRLLVIIFAVTILICSLELIRRRRLREEYALLWILTGVVVMLFAIFPGILTSVSKLLGFYYLTTVLLVSFVFLIFIVLHFSTVISRLTDRETVLAQRIAILEMKLNSIDKNK